MSLPDDFEILPDEPDEPHKPSRLWLWLLIVAAAIFVFAVGMALATFTNRLGNEDDSAATATALAAIATFTATPIAAEPATATSTVESAPATPTDTASQQPTPANATPPNATSTNAPIAQPTLTSTVPPLPPTATATVGCSRLLLAQFAPAYRAELGCPTNDAGIVWAAWEWFERGAMLWRDDNDRAYAFFNDGGWRPVDEKWEGQEVPSRGEPPTGLEAPQRGFGYAWGRSDELFQRLGWATDQERGFCSVVQTFEHGFILQDSDIEACKDNLFNQARTAEWRPLFIVAVDDSAWINLAGTPLPTVAPTVTSPSDVASTTPTATLSATTPSATTVATSTLPAITATPTATPSPSATPGVVQRQRPDGNGIFEIPNGTHTLDGNLDDWPGNWRSIEAVASGSNNYSGRDDASGEFQASWSLEGLYIAIRVRDDRYRAGPNGTDMWQGDAIELHFDRKLSDDYADNFANSDDYQLGLSWGQERNEIRLYRWLPLAQEGAFPISGAIVAEGEGYQAEVLIPWTLFDVTSEQLQPDQRFGFNLSISDNDADAPAQETVLSTSPSRTTYNDPTEWGTLILR